MKRLGRERVALAVYEPTGGFERQLEGELREGGIRGYRAHPNKVRAFARASGKEAKTDGIDAEVLALYGEVFGEEGAKEEEWDEERRDLQDIVRRRRQMVDQRAREKNRLEKRQSRKAEASIKRAIRWNTNEIGRLDREYKKALEKSRGLRQRAELYQSVRGVGELTAATLVAELPELGQGDGKGLTSLVGLAPWVARQRTAEGVSIDPRRERNGAEGVVPGGVERNTEAGKQTGENSSTSGCEGGVSPGR